MRLGALILTAAALLPTIAAAQNYAPRTTGGSVLRPAQTVAWRNYVTAPDGPCGPPMSVQTDCYVNCRPCGPFRPICFLKRVGRMLDCLIPCNLCCNKSCGGGCGSPCGGGPLHGCILGGRKYGCNVCCSTPVASGCGCNSCAHPCGSAFASCCKPSCTTSCSTPCTTGGHCHGCSSALPGLSDPFIDDPALPKASEESPPKPTAESATEVRRIPARPSRTVAAPARHVTAPRPIPTPARHVAAPRQVSAPRPVAPPARMTTVSTPKPSPYKIVRATTSAPKA
jgi:hypothetical protein